jgi:hypothetical protein
LLNVIIFFDIVKIQPGLAPALSGTRVSGLAQATQIQATHIDDVVLFRFHATPGSPHRDLLMK